MRYTRIPFAFPGSGGIYGFWHMERHLRSKSGCQGTRRPCGGDPRSTYRSAALATPPGETDLPGVPSQSTSDGNQWLFINKGRLPRVPTEITEDVLNIMKDEGCGTGSMSLATESKILTEHPRRLQLSDIVSWLCSHGGLACQAAMGDSDHSHRAVAGMLFVGYGGVIGTSWSITDRLAPPM
jgi:hypothetical protein